MHFRHFVENKVENFTDAIQGQEIKILIVPNVTASTVGARTFVHTT